MIYTKTTIEMLEPTVFEKQPRKAFSIQEKKIIPLILYLKDSLGKIIGGLNASTCSSTTFTESIWFADTCLPSLHIQKLIDKMESEASVRGCTHLFMGKPIKELMHIYNSMGYYAHHVTKDDFILLKKLKL